MSYIFFFHAFSIEFEISYLPSFSCKLNRAFAIFHYLYFDHLAELDRSMEKGTAVNQLIDRHKAQEERAIILREMTSMEKHISIEVSLLMGEYQCEGHICEC